MSKAKVLILAIFLTLVTACSTELFNQSYSPYPSEFAAENGIVTIFRESHFVGMSADAFISVGRRPFGDIGNGAGVRIGLPAGDSMIDVHTALAHDTLSIPIHVEPGRKYYIELAAQVSPIYTMGAVPYLLGRMKSNVNQYCNSSWCASIEDETIAVPKLEKIELMERVTKSSF